MHVKVNVGQFYDPRTVNAFVGDVVEFIFQSGYAILPMMAYYRYQTVNQDARSNAVDVRGPMLTGRWWIQQRACTWISSKREFSVPRLAAHLYGHQ